MKKFFVLYAFIALFIGVCFGIENCFTVGLTVYKDGNKTFIIDVIPNSPANKANITPGSEIIEINGEKTRQNDIDKINSMLSGSDGREVQLVIKNPRKENYVLQKEKIADKRDNFDEEFLSYWSKVSPKKYIKAHTLINSPKYSSSLRLEVRVNNYWVQKRGAFEKKYINCKQLNEADFEVCINEVIDKTKAQAKSEQTSLFEEEKNERTIKDTVREIEMNLDEQNFQNQMMKMYLGI